MSIESLKELVEQKTLEMKREQFSSMDNQGKAKFIIKNLRKEYKEVEQFFFNEGVEVKVNGGYNGEMSVEFAEPFERFNIKYKYDDSKKIKVYLDNQTKVEHCYIDVSDSTFNMLQVVNRKDEDNPKIKIDFSEHVKQIVNKI